MCIRDRNAERAATVTATSLSSTARSHPPGCPAGLRVSSPRRAARAVRQLCSAAYSRRSSGTLPRCVGGDLYARAGRTRHRVPLYPVEGASKPPRPSYLGFTSRQDARAQYRGHSAADALRVQQSRACHYAPPGFKKLSEKELVQTQLRIARLTSLLSKLRVGRQVLRTGTGRERNTQNAVSYTHLTLPTTPYV